MTPKDYSEFINSLELNNPYQIWPEALIALWHDAKGDWESSHNIAQNIHNHLGSWVHAYLHRKEGDEWNAGYWYRQANRPFPTQTLDEEFKQILEFVLTYK